MATSKKIILLTLFIFITACRDNVGNIQAELIKTRSVFSDDWLKDSYRMEFPKIVFYISVTNMYNSQKKINTKDYGVHEGNGLGEFWLLYNNDSKLDSTELFGASCQYCLDTVVLDKFETVSLILETEHRVLFNNQEEEQEMDKRINLINENWTSINYYDKLSGLTFKVLR